MTGRSHITALELAERLGVKSSTLAMWRVRGTGPKFIKFGLRKQGRVRYAITEIEAWEKANTASNTGAFE